MKKFASIFAVLAAAPAIAEETRQLDAHEHGVGELTIAADGNVVEIELHAPGFDIVGFEYEATAAEDLAAIEAAIETLEAPQALFGFPAAAECTLTSAHAELEGENSHDEHDHDEHKEEEHADHDHAEGESHTEFHAEYAFSCANPSAISEITFGYFDAFPNALELEVQVATAKGAAGFEVERDAGTLDLGDLF